ncbi:hypothetical protein BJ742DRAFT_829412 [Cladochytrium replicatum]|nr:hypothetical protein BJ742DRAFT_829412 [Cladochytrium replicatum]
MLGMTVFDWGRFLGCALLPTTSKTRAQRSINRRDVCSYTIAVLYSVPDFDRASLGQDHSSGSLEWLWTWPYDACKHIHAGEDSRSALYSILIVFVRTIRLIAYFGPLTQQSSLPTPQP